jgi:hypothetical protein
MYRRFGLMMAAGLIPAAVLAATDIPTRYSGSFPSSGLARNVSGTFTGKSLTLKWTVVLPNKSFGATGRFSCVATSSSATRCDGSRTTDSGQTARSGVSINWKAGRPIWAHIDKPSAL